MALSAASKADHLSRTEWLRELMVEYKQKNIDENIQWYQAFWLQSRVKNWKVNYPSALISALNLPEEQQSVYVDLPNMASTGDVETLCLALMYGEVDDMTSPLHWITEERLNWMITQLKGFLNWA